MILLFVDAYNYFTNIDFSSSYQQARKFDYLAKKCPTVIKRELVYVSARNLSL